MFMNLGSCFMLMKTLCTVMCTYSKYFYRLLPLQFLSIYRVSQKKVALSNTTHNFTKNGPIFEIFFSWPRFRSEVP